MQQENAELKIPAATATTASLTALRDPAWREALSPQAPLFPETQVAGQHHPDGRHLGSHGSPLLSSVGARTHYTPPFGRKRLDTVIIGVKEIGGVFDVKWFATRLCRLNPSAENKLDSAGDRRV